MAIYQGGTQDYLSVGSYTGQALPASPVTKYETSQQKSQSVLHFNTRIMDSGVYNTLPTANFNNVWNAGYIPFVTFGLWDLENHANDHLFSFANIASGSVDSQLTAWFQGAAAWKHPFFFRPFHEFNFSQLTNPQFPWCISTYSNWQGTGTSWTNTLSQFIAAWQHLYTLARNAGASNCTFIWCPNVMASGTLHSSVGTAYYSYAEMYPGDAYVDWLGLDGYNFGVDWSDSGWLTCNQVLGGGGGYQNSYGYLTALSKKPIYICEWGCDSLKTISYSGTLAGGGSSSVTLDSGASSSSGTYAGMMFLATAGTGAGQAAKISTYTGSTRVATFTSAVGTAFDTTTQYRIVAQDFTSKASWFTDALTTQLPQNFSQIKGFCYFDWTEDGNNYSLGYDTAIESSFDDSTTAATTAWAAAVGSPYYAHLGSPSVVRPADLQPIPPYDAIPQQSPLREALARAYPNYHALWLPLNEASGTTAADISGNSRSGSYGSGLVLAQPKLARSVLQSVDPSVLFPGTASGQVTVASNGAFSPSNQAVSVVVPFLMTVTPTGLQWIIAKGNASNYEWALGFDNVGFRGGTWQLGASATNQSGLSSTGFVPSINTPHLLCATIDPTQTNPITMWIDASQALSTTGTGSMGAGTAALTIGGRADGNAPFSGYIQHALVLSGVRLTQTDVNEFWAAFNKRRPSPHIQGV